MDKDGASGLLDRGKKTLQLITSACTILIYVYIGLSWLLELRQQLRTRGVGGGVGWDVNVHVNLRQQLMLRTRGVGGGWGGMLTFM